MKEFSKDVFETLLGGKSAIDMPGLFVQSLDDAYAFVKSYGYDLNENSDLEKAWYFHTKAVSLLQDKILKKEESIPEVLTDPNQLQDIGLLLLKASGNGESKEIQKWACAILRAMHVFAHTDNDFFYQFHDHIQAQVLDDFREHIFNDPVSGIRLGNESDPHSVVLTKYEIKPFKGTNSAVIKLLAKPYSLSINLMDKLGLRFVTKNIFDSFGVIRYLVKSHVICFANIMPDQSRNTLFPINLLFEVLEESDDFSSVEEIQSRLDKKIASDAHRAKYQERKNAYSASDFKFIKFIARKLITIEMGDQRVKFFFPFEIQIVDSRAYTQNLAGASAHGEYKNRQLEAVRNRLLGE